MTSNDSTPVVGPDAPHSPATATVVAVFSDDDETLQHVRTALGPNRVKRWIPGAGPADTAVVVIDCVDGIDPEAALAQARSGDDHPVHLMAMVSRNDPTGAARALRAGADDVIGAPLDSQELALRVARLQSQSATVDRLNDALEQAQRQLGRFAYTASHDLKEPLRAVTGFSRLLKTRYTDALDESAQTYLDFIVDGADRLSAMINALLDFARVSQQELRPEHVELGAVVTELLRRRPPEDGHLPVIVDPLPTVLTDRELVGKLLDALIDNALKFRDAGRPNTVRVSAEDVGDTVVVRVSDTGVGIPDQGRDRIFDLFSRLHTREQFPGHGIGLGLATVITQRLGGRLHAESTVGEGATLILELPAG